MNLYPKSKWEGLGRLLILLPCAYFIFATYEMTLSNPNVGFMGAFGINFALLGACVLAFVPAVGLFIYFHFLLRNDFAYRRRTYLVTGLSICTILAIHLFVALPYDAEQNSGFSANVAITLKNIVGPPGSVDSLSEQESDSREETPPDPDSVAIAFGVGLTLLGLVLWDSLRQGQKSGKPA